MPYACEVANSQAVADMVAACVVQFGQVDILVNNLGGSAAGGLIEMDEAIWDGQVEFKVKGVSLARKCALPQMISRRSVTSAVGATIRDDKLGRAKLCAKPCLQSSMVAMTERCIRLACCQVGQSPNWVMIDRSGASARAS